MNRFPCRGCGRLLFREAIVEGSVEVKCSHCNAINVVDRQKVVLLDKPLLPVVRMRQKSK